MAALPPLRREGVWEQLHEALRPKVREAEGRKPDPSAAIIDSQSVKITGRKRHIVVDSMGADSLGLLPAVAVRAAGIQDRDGAMLVIGKLPGRFPRLSLIWADGGCRGQLADWAASLFGWVLEIVQRLIWVTGFPRKRERRGECVYPAFPRRILQFWSGLDNIRISAECLH